jgi:hypothetical protein
MSICLVNAIASGCNWVILMVHITHYKDRIVDYDNNATTRARSVVAVISRQPFVMEDIYFKTYM